MSTAPVASPAPWTFAAPWGARGYVTDLDGPVHWIEFGSADGKDGTPIVFVHGLGGSHMNWCLIGPQLETVILPGVGHTPQLEVPDNVIGTIRDWLRRITPSAR